MTTRTHFTYEGKLTELLTNLCGLLKSAHGCDIDYGDAIILIDELFSEIEQSKSYD